VVEQASLFDLPAVLPKGLPDGLVYEPAFLSHDEERDLIAFIASLPLTEAMYKGYTAKRRVLSYGGSFDYDANRLMPTTALADELKPLRSRVAQWMGVEPDALVHALIGEYRPGTPLGWHRDVPDFEQIAGVSLGSAATMRFRPYGAEVKRRADVIKLVVEPRSIYRITEVARWGWQHSVAPTDALRWSVTFRTKADR
jgi:alkylated DNA repair dioxygenase AlkB